MFQNSMQTDTELFEIEEIEVYKEGLYGLVLYNDDYNTFDYVIETLMEICQHTLEQATQCTYLIHYKGKCTVKIGNFTKLAPMRNAICQRGISAEVEEI